MQTNHKRHIQTTLAQQFLAVLLRHTHYYDLISFHSVPYDDAFNLLVEPLYAVPKSWRSGLRDGDGNQDGFRHLRLRVKKRRRYNTSLEMRVWVYVSSTQTFPRRENQPSV